MAKNEAEPGIDRSAGSPPTREHRQRDNAGITGNAAVNGEKPSPGESGEPSDDQAAIDLDSARDRAS